MTHREKIYEVLRMHFEIKNQVCGHGESREAIVGKVYTMSKRDCHNEFSNIVEAICAIQKDEP